MNESEKERERKFWQPSLLIFVKFYYHFAAQHAHHLPLLPLLGIVKSDTHQLIINFSSFFEELPAKLNAYAFFPPRPALSLC
jgi:hypothetical protein